MSIVFFDAEKNFNYPMKQFWSLEYYKAPSYNIGMTLGPFVYNKKSSSRNANKRITRHFEPTL